MPLSRKKRRARLSMTSLIDVIFLLLLFFMLTSTFSKFAEVEMTTGGVGSGVSPSQSAPLFLRLSDGSITLNGAPVKRHALPDRFENVARPAQVLVSVTDSASAQDLTDVLAALRTVPDLSLAVLGPS